MQTPTHAGGVVRRRRADGEVYLLVRSSDQSSWVLPKGHIEAGENPQAAAVREVREETGVTAEIRRELGSYAYGGDTDRAVVVVYLMETSAEGVPKEERELAWLPLADAIAKASFPETRHLLGLAGIRGSESTV